MDSASRYQFFSLGPAPVLERYIAANEGPAICNWTTGLLVPIPTLPPTSVIAESPSVPALSVHLAILFCVPVPVALVPPVVVALLVVVFRLVVTVSMVVAPSVEAV